jgi:hypothetical protein
MTDPDEAEDQPEYVGADLLDTFERSTERRGPVWLTCRVELAKKQRRPYLAIAVLVPLLGASLGVNGGAIFQIIAIENLGLDARQIGLAVGLGATSIPFQIWATRIPLRLARRHLGLFVVVIAALCGLMAWLIRLPISASFVIVTAIVIAVLAEVAVSILWATSWQPLLATNVGHTFRQHLNAQARAAGNVLIIAAVTVVGWLGSDGRTAVLLVIGAAGLALLPAVNHLRSLPDALPAPVEPGLTAPADADDPGYATNLPALYVAIGLSAVPAWPFFLTYAADVFWPTANLGLMGAALTAGSLAIAAGWRPTEHGLLARARIATLLLLLCALVLIPLQRPISGLAASTLVLAIVAIASGAANAVRMSLLEVAHRRSTEATSVRILTIIDIVASTAMQLGFLAAGYLINLSVDSTWPVDPYQLSLVASPALLVLALGRLKDRA